MISSGAADSTQNQWQYQVISVDRTGAVIALPVGWQPVGYVPAVATLAEGLMIARQV